MIEPFAAAIWSTGTRLLPGIQTGEREATRVLQQPGLVFPWTEKGKALTEVYRGTTLPKGMKGFLEVAGDPLMYIGLVGGTQRLLSKPLLTAVAKGLPVSEGAKLAYGVSKVLTPVTTVERVIQKALSIPVELPLKGLAKAAGKMAYFSPKIAGEYQGRVAFNAMRASLGRAFLKGSNEDTAKLITKLAGDVNQLTPDEMLVRQSLDLVGKANPKGATFFREMLAKKSPREASE